MLDSVFATVGRWVGTRGGREAFIAVSEMKEARKYKTERAVVADSETNCSDTPGSALKVSFFLLRF